MRPFPIQFVLAALIAIAGAICDLGPRASAAYLSVADRSCCSTSGEDVGDHKLVADLVLDRGDALHSNGGMSAPASNSTSHVPPGMGQLAQVDAPASELILFLTHPEDSIHLSEFIDSLLDPPRSM